MSKFFGIIPTPPPLQSKSRVHDLKARLDWGEPALSIVDVRDRNEFKFRHIVGAVSMPLNKLVDLARSNFELERDIYVYGETDEETAVAAAQLRAAGYKNISELRGGLYAWKAVGFPVEAIVPPLKRRAPR